MRSAAAQQLLDVDLHRAAHAVSELLCLRKATSMIKAAKASAVQRGKFVHNQCKSVCLQHEETLTDSLTTSLSGSGM